MKITSLMTASFLMMALTGCQTTDTSGTSDTSGNQTQVGETPAGGLFTLRAGSETIIYGVRSRNCGDPAPSFDFVKSEFEQLPRAGDIFDAGIGTRDSGRCNGIVPVRAIGYRAPKDFVGNVRIIFYGSDQATMRVVAAEN